MEVTSVTYDAIVNSEIVSWLLIFVSSYHHLLFF